MSEEDKLHAALLVAYESTQKSIQWVKDLDLKVTTAASALIIGAVTFIPTTGNTPNWGVIIGVAAIIILCGLFLFRNHSYHISRIHVREEIERRLKIYPLMLGGTMSLCEKYRREIARCTGRKAPKSLCKKCKCKIVKLCTGRFFYFLIVVILGIGSIMASYKKEKKEPLKVEVLNSKEIPKSFVINWSPKVEIPIRIKAAPSFPTDINVQLKDFPSEFNVNLKPSPTPSPSEKAAPEEQKNAPNVANP